MIKWKDEYRLGIEGIDRQHQRLFAIANQAYQLLQDDFCIDKYDRIVQILGELKEYAVYHFRVEEEYMKSIGYRQLLSHKVQHDDFTERLNSYDLDHIDNDQDKTLLDVLDFIVAWITNHILKTDKLYAAKQQ